MVLGFKSEIPIGSMQTDAYNSMKLSARCRDAIIFRQFAALASYGSSTKEMDASLSTIITLCVTMLTEPGHKAINDFLRTAGQIFIDSFARSRKEQKLQMERVALSVLSLVTRRSWEVETRRGAENRKSLEDRFPRKEKGGLMLGII